jgi:hypothetical protein
MNNKKLPQDFVYLPEMYSDGYFPDFLVDKVKAIIVEAVGYIEEGGHSNSEIQEAFDRMTLQINSLEDEFFENESEIETAARDSIGATVIRILQFFEIDIDIEEALREREW